MTKRYLTPTTSGELALLAQRLNSMVDDGSLVILFNPAAKRTRFEFRSVATMDGKTGIVAVASVKGNSENVGK